MIELSLGQPSSIAGQQHHCNAPPWNSAKKSRNFPPSPGCTCSRTPPEKFSTSAKPIPCAAACARIFSNRIGRMRRPARWSAKSPTSITSSSTTKKKRWRWKIISSSSTSRNSTSCCATTKPIPTSTTPRSRNIPRVYVTRRLKKDGSIYFGPYFPARLAYQMVHLIHKHFLVPSCTVDLTRTHPRPCLQYYIHRCLGPCVAGLVTDERYAEAARDVRMFLEGRRSDLSHSLEIRMQAASEQRTIRRSRQLPRPAPHHRRNGGAPENRRRCRRRYRRAGAGTPNRRRSP